MIEGIVAVALENRPRFRAISSQPRAVDAARICYDHLAGRLSVALADALIARECIVIDGEAVAITAVGARFSTSSGSRFRPGVRVVFPLAASDRTERRPHIAGPLGAALPSVFSILAGSKRRGAAMPGRHLVGKTGPCGDFWRRRLRTNRARQTLTAVAGR